MNRLTGRSKNGRAFAKPTTADRQIKNIDILWGDSKYDYSHIIERLAQYEDAEECGKLVRIIKCEDCCHFRDNDCPATNWGRTTDDFCSWAEEDDGCSCEECGDCSIFDTGRCRKAEE